MEVIPEINVEVVLKHHCTIKVKMVIDACKEYMKQKKLRTGSIISSFTKDEEILAESVEHILIENSKKQEDLYLDLNKTTINFYVYTLDSNGAQVESCEDDSGGEVNLATHWVLPSYDMFNLWENLVYDGNIKEDLLSYANSMMLLSDRGVDPNIISFNRVILLHGPPGTGKTSLCKALAHKLSIRMQNRFSNCTLVEINSHSLFSKWFSESGKLVTKMFSNLRDIVEERKMLVCVLIDEIESLAHARDQCMSGNEPSDSIRVVNAVLTEIDKIKRYPNVLVLTTSNITGAIDVAFVDRADIKQYLGMPGVEAIYQIYYSCIQELLKTEIITKREVISPGNILQLMKYPELDNASYSHKLIKLSEQSVGFSGRTLRKIPLLAHSLFLKRNICNLEQFYEAMSKAIDYEKVQRESFERK